MCRIKQINLTLLLLFVLSSCAQVGTITGGSKDTAAPQPIASKVYPPNASLNIKPTQIEIPFDEYIQLVNPLENIIVTPNTLKVKSSIKNKTLVLQLEGEYLENTTYSIQFNRAIQDITERNDSIFSYVFSTGPQIDKNKASFIVLDAYKKTPKQEVSVGLFHKKIVKDSLIKPIYQTLTDKNGRASFDYIKSNNYFVYAYDDLDNNGTLSYGETAGYIDTVYSVADTIERNTEIKVSKQNQPFKISTAYIFPSIWKIWSTNIIDTALLEFTNPKPKMIYIEDTIYAYYKNTEMNSVQLVYEEDTLTKRIKNQGIQLNTLNNLNKKKLNYNEKLQLRFNDVVENIDYTNIRVNGKQILDTALTLSPNQLEISFNNSLFSDSTTLEIVPKAIHFYHLEQKDTLSYTFFKQQLNDVGNLVVVADSLFKPGLLQLMLNDEVVREAITTSKTTSITFNHLQPETYSFRFIEDSNSDGKWTPGNVYTRQMPENIIWFTSSSKVRANWDIEAKLQF